MGLQTWFAFWMTAQTSMNDYFVQRCFPVSQTVIKIMIIYWKQSLTAMNIKSRYFLPWLSSMPPCLVFNLDTMASLWSHLFICWFASSCNALFHIVFHPFVSITQILVFFFFLIYHIFLCAFLSALNSVYCIKKKKLPFLYTDLPKASLLFEVSLCGVWLSFLCYLCTSHIPPNKQ